MLPFSPADCYRYWGIEKKYAAVAADGATSIADPTTQPTVFNLQLSLLLALLEAVMPAGKATHPYVCHFDP